MDNIHHLREAPTLGNSYADTDVTLPAAEKVESLTVEHDDGSVTINFEKPKDESQVSSKEHFDNIADTIDPTVLSTMANELLQLIEADDQSRTDWLEMQATGVKLLGLKIETPKGDAGASSSPVEGMSTVRHPMLLENVLRFQANARGELLPANGPVKVRVDGDQNSVKDEIAEALERDMNHYLTVTLKSYYPDTIRMLFGVGGAGSGFKKLYHCPLKRRPVSVSVPAEDIIVSNSATDLESAGRITHRIKMRPSVFKRMQLIGAYRDVSVVDPVLPTQNALDTQKQEVAGIDPSLSQNTSQPALMDREIYECYCEWDIKGFEHKENGEITGLPLPWKIVIDKASMQVLEISRNWNENDSDYERRKVFVQYPFVLGIGFYGLGLFHILGNSELALTAAWREMLDAGMFANFPGFLYAKSLGRQNTNEFRVAPGSGAAVDLGGLASIRDAVMELPYKDVGPSLLQLVENIAQSTGRLGGTAEMMVGEGRQDAPVGTTIALIEQATKIVDAVHKNLHSAQAEEFQILKQLIKEDIEGFLRGMPKNEWDEAKLKAALDNNDIVPAADPNTPSHMHRLLKAVALKQLQQANPQLYDAKKVDERILKIMGYEDPESMFAAPAQPAPDPTAMALMAQLQLKERELKLKEGDQQLKLKQQVMDAAERQKDRDSKEAIELLKLATSLVIHPESEGVAEAALLGTGRKLIDANNSPPPVANGGRINGGHNHVI